MRTSGAFGLAAVLVVLATGCDPKGDKALDTSGSGGGRNDAAPSTTQTRDRAMDTSGSGGVPAGTSSGGTGGQTSAPPIGGSGGLGSDQTGSAGTKGTSSGGQSGACTITWSVDAPCNLTALRTPKCTKGAPSSRLVGHEVSCAEAMGTPCCTGGGCRASSEPCEAGQGCAYPNATPSFFGDIEAKCVPSTELCGGTENKACPTGQYCEHSGYFCDSSSCYSPHDLCDYAKSGGLGVCHPLPTESECLKTDRPMCGCDAVTYPNDCARKKANAAWAYDGACR